MRDDDASKQPPPPPRIDRELADGDELSFGDGAIAIAVPGHTPGSVAIYLPEHQVLFTGDAAARAQVRRRRTAPTRAGPGKASALQCRPWRALSSCAARPGQGNPPSPGNTSSRA
jgi:glyoxylase-like metal-dependent hydrolase (beta-lactamase superfamily II)